MKRVNICGEVSASGELSCCLLSLRQCLHLSACVCVSVECEFSTDAEVGGAEGGGRPPSLWEEQSNGSVKKTFSKKNQLH